MNILGGGQYNEHGLQLWGGKFDFDENYERLTLLRIFDVQDKTKKFFNYDGVDSLQIKMLKKKKIFDKFGCAVEAQKKTWKIQFCSQSWSPQCIFSIW